MAVRILLADDHEQIRSALAQLIRSAGWEVCSAVADGETAIEKAAELKPDLIILDFLMPQRDGISAGREIHSLMPGVPVLLFTMFSSPYIESEAKRVGFQGVVQKPDGYGLVDAIRHALSIGPSTTVH